MSDPETACRTKPRRWAGVGEGGRGAPTPPRPPRPRRPRTHPLPPTSSFQVPTQVKVDLVHRLAAAGVPVVEATAFVSPRAVPQMADAAAVLAALTPHPGTRYPVLVPNLKGFERALAAGAAEVAIFASASETFSRRNTNASVAESLARYRDVAAAAADAGVRVRGYVSCAVGCPYEARETDGVRGARGGAASEVAGPGGGRGGGARWPPTPLSIHHHNPQPLPGPGQASCGRPGGGRPARPGVLRGVDG